MIREPSSNQLHAVRSAVRAAGSQSELARQIGTSQATVWKWLNKGLTVSAELAIKIEEVTKGQVTSQQLRPDVFGPRDTADGHANPINLKACR